MGCGYVVHELISPRQLELYTESLNFIKSGFRCVIVEPNNVMCMKTKIFQLYWQQCICKGLCPSLWHMKSDTVLTDRERSSPVTKHLWNQEVFQIHRPITVQCTMQANL
jgi:hypothetical protein